MSTKATEKKDICTLCERQKDPINHNLCTNCYHSSACSADDNPHLYENSPALLSSCLALIDLVEEYEEEHGISIAGAAILHDARIATLNAQGLKEEGYNC